jgi:HD-GYP domain-containing protein (c-di-GMP phosphodiesterase class II)
LLLNGRVYREAVSSQEALKEIIDCARSQFDPKLVDIFIKIITE